MRKLGYVVAAVAVILAATVTNAVATPALLPAPEINPGSVAAGLGLLTGGVLILRARFGR